MTARSNANKDEGSCWLQAKDFWSLVDDAVVRKLPGIRPDLEAGLKKNKSTFKNLLKNPARSASDLDLVRKSATDGIHLPFLGGSGSGGGGGGGRANSASDGGGGVRKMPSQVVEEALIVSEMFDLNEMSALQLILHGEERLCDHPGQTRGLVAILLYYDARKTVVDTLRALILGCRGATWTLETSEDIVNLVTDFTKDLVSKDNLVQTILNLLKSLNWQSELGKLQKNMALGDARHRSQVEELFKGIQKGLAGCLFALAAQLGLGVADTLKLANHLAGIKLEDTNADCSLDDVDIALVMALLYALDISRVGQLSDADAARVSLPILEDPTAVATLHKELYQSPSSRDWNHEGIASLVRFAWAMTLATMRTGAGSSPPRPDVQGLVDDDELVLDSALSSGAFHWLSKCILLSPSISREEFYLRRMHQLLTDLIVYMPLKVKELRNRADDAARNKLMHEQEGIQFNVPLQGQHFGQLLSSVAKLYNDIEDGSHLELVLDYWCPIETSTAGGATSGGGGMERYPTRKISLYKFLRLAGDLLMPSLYTPYLEMLASLSRHSQASLHCFNLLKLNGMGQGQGGVANGGVGNSISWDHFFSSLHQYFVNLRQENQLATSDTIYRLRPMTKGISPAEIQGLAAVLKLITVVSDHSEPARLAFAQRPEWQPVPIMVGLLGCSVPSMLKAELLKTLTSLAKSPEIALDVWNGLEASNFITVSGTNSVQKGGFILELETVETQSEDFSMTLAFLDLLNVLIDNYPFIVGSNVKSSQGFEMYNHLLIDDIFINFYHKAYKSPEQKWRICQASLKVLNRLLTDDNLIGSDANSLVQGAAGNSAGSRILTYLNQPSELLRLLLHILDEGCSAIESCIKFPGKAQVEDCCLHVLRILRRGLELQPLLLKAARDSPNSSAVYSGLDKLLLGVNPRTGKADHVLTVAKFVAFFGSLPQHSIQAVNLITAISSPANQTALLAEFNATDAVAKVIVKGATDIIDSGLVAFEGREDDYDDADENDAVAKAEKVARLSLVELFQKCSCFPTPNLTHFFLGLDVTNNVSRSDIRPPGVAGGVRTPFHAMIACLQATDEAGTFIQRAPLTAEAILKLLFTLSSNLETTGPVLRYLHSSDHFFINQLSQLPLRGGDVTGGIGGVIIPEALRAQSWLMKTAAIQLKGICHARLRSQLTNWINLLLSPSRNLVTSSNEAASEATLTSDLTEADLNQLSHAGVLNMKKTSAGSGPGGLSANLGDSGGVGGGGGLGTRGQSHNRLLTILNSLAFEEVSVEAPALEIFDGDLIKGVLNKCRTVQAADGSGVTLIDIPGKLHAILRQEIAAIGGSTGMNQRQIIRDEVDSILRYALRLNAATIEMEARRSLLDAWRQIAEVVFCCTPTDILSNSTRQQILLELLQTLLNKVLSDGSSPELTSPVSGIVLLLLTALRHTYNGRRGGGGVAGGDQSNDQYVPLLDATMGSADSRMWSKNNRSSNSAFPVYPTALQVVLKGLVTWISSTSAVYQRVRANLYGGLLNYLRIGKDNNDGSSLEVMRLRKANLEALTGFGDSLMEIICRDTVSGHDVRRILALALLDELIALDSNGSTWMWYISREGYLKNIIETLVRGDSELLNLLSPNNAAGKERWLHTYESKMAFFTRMACSVAGAELLLESGLMVRLSEMKVFSARPEAAYQMVASTAAAGNQAAAAPRSLEVYRQILFPALRLCMAVLSCLGTSNVSAVTHVRFFIKANEQIFRTILHPPSHESMSSIAGLEEVALMTGVLAKCGPLDETVDSEGFVLLKQQMLSLIHHFDASNHLVKKSLELLAASGAQDQRLKCLVRNLLIQIAANLHAFVRHVACSSGNGKRNVNCKIIFSPKMSDGGSSNDHVVLAGRPLNLGQVLRAVQSMSAQLIESHASLTDAAASSGAGAGADQQLRQSLATDIKNLGSAIESTLWVIWKHAEYFSRFGSGGGGSGANDQSGLDMFAGGNKNDESSGGVGRELRLLFTDDVFMQLLDVDKLYNNNNFSSNNMIQQQQQPGPQGFINTLVRRLKRITNKPTAH